MQSNKTSLLRRSSLQERNIAKSSNFETFYQDYQSSTSVQTYKHFLKLCLYLRKVFCFSCFISTHNIICNRVGDCFVYRHCFSFLFSF